MPFRDTKKIITKKIIIAGAAIFPDGAGGAPRCIHMLAKGFASNGHEVEVVTTYGSERERRNMRIDNFSFRSFGYFSTDANNIQYFTKLKTHVLLIAYLLQRTLRGNYDYLLFYGSLFNFVLVGIIAAVMDRRCIYFTGDIQPKYDNMRNTAKIKRLLANLTDIFLARIAGLIVVLGTSKLVQRYMRVAPQNAHVQILAPVDCDVFAAGNGQIFREQYGLKDNKIVTYSGTLDTIEGVHLLIEAIKYVSKTHPNVSLVIAGPEAKIDRVAGKVIDFKEIAQKHNVADFVTFTGHIQLQEVIDLLNASDVLVMPKISHPLNHVASPIKIAEYLAAGRPIVVSRICELEKHLTHMEHVYFCEPGNVTDLADAINDILNNEALSSKLSRNATLISKQLFDYRIIADTIYNYAHLRGVQCGKQETIT